MYTEDTCRQHSAAAFKVTVFDSPDLASEAKHPIRSHAEVYSVSVFGFQPKLPVCWITMRSRANAACRVLAIARSRDVVSGPEIGIVRFQPVTEYQV